MEVRPVGTTNFWSLFKLDGDYRMDVDYFPQPAEKGGFMVTFCGEAVNPVSQKRPSASVAVPVSALLAPLVPSLPVTGIPCRRGGPQLALNGIRIQTLAMLQDPETRRPEDFHAP